MTQLPSLLYVAVDSISDTPHQSMSAFWLKSEGWPVKMLATKCKDPFPKTPIAEIENVDILLNCRYSNKDLFGCINTARKIRELGTFDIIYLQGSPNSLLGIVLKMVLGRRQILVYHSQDFIEPTHFNISTQLEKSICRLSDLVVWNDENRGRIAQSCYGLKDTPVTVRTSLPEKWPLPDPMEVHASIADLRRRFGAECTLIYAGSNVSSKRNTGPLLEAFDNLPDDYVLIFTGERTADQNNQISGLVSKGNYERVVSVPRMEYQESLLFASGCDIGVLLYPNDSLGNFYQQPSRISEYVRLGLPVLGSDFPNFRSALKENPNYRLVRPDRKEEIQQAIISLREVSQTRADISNCPFVNMYDHDCARLSIRLMALAEKAT